MNHKNLFLILLLFVGFACTQQKSPKIFEQSKNYPEELQQLHQNVLTNILDEPADLEEVKKLLKDMQENGTWANIDYTSKERGGWPPRQHLSNLLEIAKAYQTIGTDLYQNKDVLAKMQLALNFWLENDLICPNWWYPEIGVPMVLAPVMILMEVELSPEQKEKGIKILDRSAIAMTGTPVENSLMDLWCIVDFCSPGLLENAKSFSHQFQTPLKNKDTDSAQLYENIRSKIVGILMRRMKVDVAKDLPTIDYFKFSEEMPPEQFNIYQNELSNIQQLKANGASVNPVLQGIFNLRSISDHPYLKHYQLENFSSDELINASAKLKKVISILSEISKLEEKVILFTENKSMQRVLRRIVIENFSITPSIINGETPTSISKTKKSKLSRQQEIDKYQKKNGFNVIIMSPVAAGFGLNITEANHVIHYTRHWNPAKEQQATDRAYRIGQKKPVKVYYPLAVAPNNVIKTFDIVLDELLGRKSHLASSTLFPTEQIEISKEDFLNAMSVDGSEKTSVIIKNIESLDKLQPLVFEAAIALLLENKFDGNTWLTPKSNDKGADIIHFNENHNFLIQVKQSVSKLGINSGQEINYALPEYRNKYQRDFKPQVITNSFFNQNAIDLAKQHNIELIDRKVIKNWIHEFPLNIDEIDNKLNDRISCI